MADDTQNGPAKFDWPLMKNNIPRADLDRVIEFLQGDEPILTQSSQVRQFEREWSNWLGVKHSVFVNSGSSANLLSMAALKESVPAGEIIVPTLTWVSQIASVIQCGFDPVFVDINPKTLGMDTDEVLKKLTADTRAVYLTHVLGYNALTQRLLDELAARQIPLIEDVSESYGATFEGRKLGTFGLMASFSFYYAHHLTTIEGGMISTNDDDLYQTLRMLRSHGMVREADSETLKQTYLDAHPDLSPDFIFAFPGYNVRSTEINAVIGLSQLKRLDENNQLRSRNLKLFLENLDSAKYRTDFELEGSCNYAFTLVLKQPDPVLRDNVEQALADNGVEFRRGASGGGNQLRQPYLKRILGETACEEFPQVDHIHFYGFYIGNYRDLTPDAIRELCRLLNGLPTG